jgi:hypothetical protein
MDILKCPKKKFSKKFPKEFITRKSLPIFLYKNNCIYALICKFTQISRHKWNLFSVLRNKIINYMNITNDNMMCNILTVLKRPKRGARGGEKGGKNAKKDEKYGDFSLGVIFLP